MASEIRLRVNGKKYSYTGDENRFLLDWLRDELGLVGTKNGCHTGHCGTCTLLIDGQAKRSCIIKMGKCEGKVIETIESLGSEDHLHPLQQAFIDEGAVQCGFCTPGMLMASKALLDVNPMPTTSEIRYALRNNICRCTGYGAIVRAVKNAAEVMNGASYQAEEISGPVYVGVNVAKKDAIPKAIGARMFADDYQVEDAIYGQALFSDYAHAKILSIDTTPAQAIEGVVKVATYKDVPGINKFGLFVPQQPVICSEEVKYLGDVVACVYAESKALALEAAKKIVVTYEPLEALLNPEDNFKENSPRIHRDTENNVIHHVDVRKGDTDAGFELADVIIEGTYNTQAVEHAYMEPESCLSAYQDGKLVLYSGNQGSFAYKRMIQANLDLNDKEVRVIFTATGGGFGGKEEPTVQILGALGTYLTKRPVKMALTREESIRMSIKRHPMKITMRHGVTKDGEIVAMESYAVGDGGAYISQTAPVIFRSAVTASGPYKVTNVKADSYGIYTHKNPSGAFRGFGSTQASFACESQMDQLAEAIGMTPYELRAKNAFASGVVTSTGQVLRDGIGYKGTLDAVNNSMEKMKEVYAHLELGPDEAIGYGLGSAYKNVGIGTGKPDKAGAYVELLPKGKFLISMGATDMGQGVDTLCAQIAATAMKVPYELIDVIACDTETCPDGGMTTASRQTYVTGNAVRCASELMLKRMKQVLGQETLPTTTEGLKALYENFEEQSVEVKVVYDYYPPKTYAHKTDANHKPGEDVSSYDIHYSYCFASSSVAVKVNSATGLVEVLKIAVAQDVGKAIHPKNIIGQIEGSAAMGIGLALQEDFRVTDREVETNTLKKIKVPTIQEIPDIESIIIEEEQLEGPYGAKGMGEVGLNPVAPAIANAIYDAIGVRLRSLPMTPDKVLEGIAGRERVRKRENERKRERKLES